MLKALCGWQGIDAGVLTSEWRVVVCSASFIIDFFLLSLPPF
jgi:hypothetical protein